MIQLDAVETLAFGGVVLFVGYALCRFVPVLGRYNIPEPVIGGLVVALIALVAHRFNTTLVEFDTSLQQPLMVAFFTTVGVNASLALLRVSGRQVMIFLAGNVQLVAAGDMLRIGIG